jgi:transcription elongation factor Elf1
MDEVEKFFRCPYCSEKISMLLDMSVDDHQEYVEDCEVCCRPIQVQYAAHNGELLDFRASAI